MSRNDGILKFQGQQVRRVWYNEEWWLVVNDVVKALTDSTNVNSYIKAMRRRDEELSKGWSQIVTPLAVATKGGKQKVNCANKEGIFRIIQSISSPKAEPFKRWFAKVASDRVEETDNPELIIERFKALYRGRGYSDDWIDERLRGIDVRKLLTEEWQRRGIKEGLEFAKLTNVITQGTFGKTVGQYKKHKRLKNRHHLRDNMTEIELLFNRLGELGTREQIQEADAQGYIENEQAARKGGQAAGNARKAYEKTTGRNVISNRNYLQQIEDAKKKDKLDPPSSD